VARGGDRGGATVEFVIAMPMLMLMILFIIQAAVWMHATHVAQAAANRALDAAAAYGASAAQGQTAGDQTLAALGSGVLKDPHVTVTRTATDVHGVCCINRSQDRFAAGFAVVIHYGVR
jgi:Flp pilus assembly protein TadG